jgi:Holliday junction resolvasome RuvABC endonuclease subunit
MSTEAPEPKDPGELHGGAASRRVARAVSLTLALDPGIRSTGWALVDDDSDEAPAVVLEAGLIETTRDEGLTVTDDARRAVFEILGELDERVRLYYDAPCNPPKRLVVEAFTSQGKATWAALQSLRLLGALEEWGTMRGMAYYEVTTQSAKTRIGLELDATKDEVLERVLELGADSDAPWLVGLAKAARYHVADAIAVGLAAQGGR